jgi:NitT/TauT family transport system substrate-binding protein
MSARTRLAGIAAAALLTAVSPAAQAEPLRIGYLTWIGFGPLFLAQKKGFFAKEGVEVELINMAIHEAMYAGLFAGQVDAITATVDDMLPHFDPEHPYACVLALDESHGGDGIVANKDIKSIADLRGKTVAFPKGTVSEFYLNEEADLKTVDLGADDAGNSFLMQEVDAAVTWEPWLTQGKQAPHGHLLADSSETPGVIVDCLVTKTDVLDARLTEFRALARAWDEAVRYAEANPEEANSIMARHVGGGEDPAAFAAALKGVRFYDAASNRKFFGTRENPGQIYQTSQYAIDVWSSLGALHTKLTPDQVIRPDLWAE